MKKIYILILALLMAMPSMAQQSKVLKPLREKSKEFYLTEEARRIGDQVLLYQRVTGGWPKNIDMAKPLGKEERDTEAITELNEVVKDIYQKIMSNPKMLVYNAAKQGYDELTNEVNTIISMSLNGTAPESIDPATAGCTGSCSTCGGCG